MSTLTLRLTGISCYISDPVDNWKCWNLTLKLIPIILSINQSINQSVTNNEQREKPKIKKEEMKMDKIN